MYHVYEIATQNEGIDWHVYAEYQEDVRTMITNLNGFMLQECRDLAKAINYQSIASKLKSGTGCGREKQEIKSFFARFHRPLIKQHGEALVGFAGIKLGFGTARGKETGHREKDIFLVELVNTMQLCQFLNYLPYVHIYAVSCS